MLPCESVSCKTGTLKTGQTNPQPIRSEPPPHPPAAGGVADRFRSNEGFWGKLRQIEASCTSTCGPTVGYFRKGRTACVRGSCSVILKTFNSMKVMKVNIECFLRCVARHCCIKRAADWLCLCFSLCLSYLSGGLQREEWKLLQTWRVCVSINKCEVLK